MTKHTPGPWFTVIDDFGDQIVITCQARDGLVDVAALPYGYEDWLNQEQQANARLMAAAPELLEALAQYVILGPGKCVIGKPCVDKALAAIAKATGENNE